MRGQPLADGGFEKFRIGISKERFRDEMEQIVPWKEFTRVIELYCPKSECAGRTPVQGEVRSG
jgi:hypothetical protein